MESIKIRISEDEDYGFIIEAVAPVLVEKTALYIGPEKSMWLLDYERALAVIDDYAEECMSAMIGKSDYIIIYPAESAVNVDGDNFIMGECLIMKSDHGVKCMTQRETVEAFVEYASRTKTVYAGQYGLPAYQVD